eukprot:UN11810
MVTILWVGMGSIMSSLMASLGMHDNSPGLDVNNMYHVILIIIAFALCPCYLVKCVGEFAGHTIFSNGTMKGFSIIIAVLNLYQFCVWGSNSFFTNDDIHCTYADSLCYYTLFALYVQLLIFIPMAYQFYKQFNYVYPPSVHQPLDNA